MSSRKLQLACRRAQRARRSENIHEWLYERSMAWSLESCRAPPAPPPPVLPADTFLGARRDVACCRPHRPLCGPPHCRGGKPRPRPRSQRRGPVDALSLDSEEAAALEEQLGVAPAELPPHLQRYALQRRSAASFSGPGVLPGEVEAGGWDREPAGGRPF